MVKVGEGVLPGAFAVCSRLPVFNSATGHNFMVRTGFLRIVHNAVNDP